ncbi:MAG: carboxymuconolactone decarboxylase family protein [Kordiimonadaceae bacterium]|mgnify:FL=1|jgi:AhpD family alkylhydroperoxidase|nr:carboxymuconolactone decarboxylase family protein [Kordiimonadaceae bacterium]MDC0082256.1 carboxymuconolactone decarboxylase family protein [Emcibacteraceae bacterium]MBT6135192.1 carboxymuconolactone decarboxylase family protein [Kordiimonadaceae bacterium]MBT6467651.1 carboxymuconolactone decarboxylase family protein [Kordiimonadaceae bacterium]MBT7544220.1 carboxymuconolactone decarboxylase family protein [Kordiimonadaceae bacterium]
MSTRKPSANLEKNSRVKAVFDDIRRVRKSAFINNMWHYIAFDEDLLERTWADVKRVMSEPSEIEPMTKELIYLAVSIANSCTYCVHSHTAAARSKGMSDKQYAELIKIVSLAARTNHIANGLQIPVDDVFDADKN